MTFEDQVWEMHEQGVSDARIASLLATTRHQVRKALGKPNARLKRIDAAPVRDAAQAAVDAGTTSWRQIAAQLGYFKHQPDSQRARRRLGLANSRYNERPNQTVDYDLAVKVAAIIGIDPADVGV